MRLYTSAGTIALALVLVLMAAPSARRTALAQTPTTPSCGSPRAAGEVAIIGHTNAATGTVVIPELNLTASITNGCFEFRNLVLPQDPMLITFEVTADGFRPTTWMHDILFGGTSGGPDRTLTLEPGTEPEVFDPCPTLIANPQTQSAAIQEQAGLCAQLQGSSLPSTGAGQRMSPTPLGALLLLALGGVMALTAGAALRLRRR